MIRNSFAASLLAATIALTIFAQAPAKVDFRREVKPILKQNCVGCHGPAQQMNGFRLDQRRYAMPNRIGANGARIVPGDSDNSLLYIKVSSNKAGLQMPPTGALTDDEVGTIRTWINQGADWPDDADDLPAPAVDPKTTRILEALRKGDRKTVVGLMTTDTTIINKTDANGTTPLMYAALYGQPDTVQWLLSKGADPNLKNDAGATALMWALEDVEKTRLLIEHKADLNVLSGDGRSPLMIAVAQSAADPIVQLLLDHGAKANAKSPTGLTSLTFAAPFGSEKVMRSLFDHGADGKSGTTGLLVQTLRTGCRECLDLLLPLVDSKVSSEALASPGAPIEDTPAIQFLLDRGANVNFAGGGGQTALMNAAYSDFVPSDSVKLLLERGADVNAKNSNNETPLQFALQRGHTASVDLLTQAGAHSDATIDAALQAPSPVSSARSAVQRILPLLQRTDVSFYRKSGCISCHNNSLTSLTVTAARTNRFTVDEAIQASQMKETALYAETWRERMLQGIGIPGGPDTISYILLGLAAGEYPSNETTDAMARYLKLRQSPDGHWSIAALRPPLESSSIELTAVSLRALQSYAPPTQRMEYEAAIRRAVAWLATAQPQTNEDRAFQLLGLAWGKVKPDAIRTGANELVQQQRSDGGWAQLPTLSSDAYATGQALVALKETAALKTTDSAYQRGVAFLLKTQFEDGSWYAKSRAIKIQPYFDNGFPHGQDQWISAAASNWATMALVAAAR